MGRCGVPLADALFVVDDDNRDIALLLMIDDAVADI